MSASRPTCSTCPYWNPPSDIDGGIYGGCRVRSVQMVDISHTVWDWPPRSATDWCGEHPDFPKTERTAPKLAPGSAIPVDDLKKASSQCPAENQLTEQTLDEDSTWERCILPWSHTIPCRFEAAPP